MAIVRVAIHAMATRFELVLHGTNPVSLRSAGEEAIAEIERLDGVLSAHRPGSEVSELNRSAGTRPVRVTPEVFSLLRHAVMLSHATRGAFDITVGPLLRTWGFHAGTGRFPEISEIEAALKHVGSACLQFDEPSCSVSFTSPDVRIDLGAIGKGYAIDRAAEYLRESGVEHALLHGGTSTALASGHPEDGDVWKVAIAHPDPSRDSPIAIVSLSDESLSVSAPRGKGFTQGERFYGHVIDPRTGFPARSAALAAVVLPSATDSDALSTALLIEGESMLDRVTTTGTNARALIACAETGEKEHRIFHRRLPPLPT